MAKVLYEDLSGVSTNVTPNPYDGILQTCKNDPKTIQDRYHLHRVTRNKQQREKILSPDFQGWILDEVLVKLDGRQRDPCFHDPRHCLVFWARPTQKIKYLIEVVQQKLKDAAPGIWLMPVPNLHMTAMEVAHSLTFTEVDALVTALLPSSQPIADLPSIPGHHARLIKPMLSFDAAALALSFVPAAGEAIWHEPQRLTTEDEYSYHHLRRDLYSAISQAGIPIGSRYVVPSAHLTIARFNSPNPFASQDGDPLDEVAGVSLEHRQKLVKEIDLINQWLEGEFWPKLAKPKSSATLEVTAKNKEHSTRCVDDNSTTSLDEQTEVIKPGGEWIVGEEKGLDFRKGTLWYGGGETVYLGKGIGKV